MSQLGGGQPGYSEFNDGQGSGAHAVDMPRQEKPVRTYQDKEWALIFLIHAGLVAMIAGMFGQETMDEFAAAQANATAESTLTPEQQQWTNDALSRIVPFLAMGFAVALGWAVLWMAIVQRFAEQLIYAALFAGVAFASMVLLAGLASGLPVLIGMGLIMTIFAGGYAYWIIFYQQERIAFAKLTLETVADVTRKFPGTWISSVLAAVPAVVWTAAWGFAVVGAAVHFSKLAVKVSYIDKETGEPKEGYDIPASGKLCFFFLALSAYWTNQVLINIVHVTVSGVMGEWYFSGERNMSRAPTLNSLSRAMTTSFGSICLGSLLVALVQMLRDMLERARRDTDNAAAAVILCCIACCMGWIEALVELFNHWAFVQVAIYGSDFKTAARNTMQLVKSRGLSGLVNMNLTGQATTLGVLVGGLLSGGVVAIAGYASLVSGPQSVAAESGDTTRSDIYMGAYILLIIFSAIFGFAFTSTVSKTIISGTTTLFVCWAEQPASLQHSNPELHSKFEDITRQFLVDNGQPAYLPGPNVPTSQRMQHH